MAKAKTDTTHKSLRKSAVSTAYQSGLQLVPKVKLPKDQLATPESIADVDWTPWTRDPSLGESGLLPQDETMRECGVAARMSYAIMLMEKKELVAMHGKVDHEHVDAMMGDMAHAAESLKTVVQMIEAAYLRVLASASYRALRTRGRFKGVSRRPNRSEL